MGEIYVGIGAVILHGASTSIDPAAAPKHGAFVGSYLANSSLPTIGAIFGPVQTPLPVLWAQQRQIGRISASVNNAAAMDGEAATPLIDIVVMEAATAGMPGGLLATSGCTINRAASGVRTDLAILNLQPSDLVVSASARALAKTLGEVVVSSAELVILAEGETLTIVAHGSTNRLGGMKVAELANLLKNKNLAPAEIELILCKTGKGNFAQYLADLMGVPVRAPKANINVLSDVFGVPQVRDPKTKILKPPGEWIETFMPRTNFTSPVSPKF